MSYQDYDLAELYERDQERFEAAMDEADRIMDEHVTCDFCGAFVRLTGICPECSKRCER